MVWYGLVKVLKLNSRPLFNHLINDKGGHRAARAAKNKILKLVGSFGWFGRFDRFDYFN